MLGRLLWIGGIALELLLLIRGLCTPLAKKYPVFYLYILYVLLQSLVRFWVYHRFPASYMESYWYTEFFGVIVGSGVLFEIYRTGLAPYPGTARLARNALALVFAVAVGKALAASFRGPLWWPARTTAELERNLRAVQAFAILGLVILLLAYSIPLGRNLRGIVLGYALFIATSLANLAALASPGKEFQQLWSYSQQLFYLLVLCIWTVSLWTLSSHAEVPRGAEPPTPYKDAERETRDRWKRIRIFNRRNKDKDSRE